MKILVLCTGNSCRSQMAEALLRSFDPRIEAHSAGSRPAERVNPYAVRVMAEEGLDLSQGRPKSVDEFLGQPIDFVVTVCGNARDECPVFTGQVGERLHIGFDDPADATGTDDEIMAVFRASRDEIREGFRRFYEEKVLPKLEKGS
jgi:arsenate reductase (thioredoxin)